MSDIHERNLRKALKALYDDLLEAEGGPDRNTFGFKQRLKVIHENLEEMMPRLLAIFPHLGEFSSFGDFETEYYHRGDPGMDQLLKSEIKKLAVEIDADLIIDDTLIDIKTTKNLKFERDHYDQLIGYYILNKIGGINGVNNHKIQNIAIYFSRHGVLHSFPISPIEKNPKFDSMVEWFKDEAKKVFNQNI